MKIQKMQLPKFLSSWDQISFTGFMYCDNFDKMENIYDKISDYTKGNGCDEINDYFSLANPRWVSDVLGSVDMEEDKQRLFLDFQQCHTIETLLLLGLFINNDSEVLSWCTLCDTCEVDRELLVISDNTATFFTIKEMVDTFIKCKSFTNLQWL